MSAAKQRKLEQEEEKRLKEEMKTEEEKYADVIAHRGEAVVKEKPAHWSKKEKQIGLKI